MRFKEFLLEYNRQITADKLGEKLYAAWRIDFKQPYQPENIQMWLKSLLEKLENADPTPHKEYTEWLARIYANGSVKLEDIMSRGKDALDRFNRLKIKKKLQPADRDINRLRSLDDLENLMGKYTEVTDEIVDKGKAKIIFQDAHLRIIQPLDIAAAKYYGQGTRWCTAADSNNQFENYNKKGPLYIILLTKPAVPGEKYQFSFSTKQFMDPKDNECDLSSLANRYPQLRQVFSREADRVKCIPLMANGQQIVDNWGLITEHVSMMMIPDMIPFKNLLANLRVELARDAALPKSIALKICEELYTTLTDETNFENLIEFITRQITPLNFQIEDARYDLFSDIMYDFSGQEVYSILGSADDNYGNEVDSMAAWLDIYHYVFDPIIEQVDVSINSMIDAIDEIA